MLKRLISKTSLLALTLLAVIAFIAINYGLSRFNQRIDFTEDQIFTLSPGAQQLITEIKSPVTIRYYLSEGDNVLPVELRNYADRVGDFLQNLVDQADGKIKLVYRDPQPDSDAEEDAEIDGLYGHPVTKDAVAYMGLSLNSLTRTITIPFLNPKREANLEFDVMTALRDVITTEKKKAALFSTLPVFGMENSYPQWALVDELARKFNLLPLEGNEQTLPEGLDLLVLVHPKGMTDAFQQAIDSYLADGGNLVVMLDTVAVSNLFYGIRGNEENTQSDFPALVNALGYEFTPRRAILDMRLKDEIDRGEGTEILNSLLSLKSDGINSAHPITSDVNGLKIPVSGTFLGAPAAGLDATILLSSTEDSQLYPHKDLIGLSKRTGEKTLNEFKADENVYPIAVLLRGEMPAFTVLDFPQRKPANVLLLADTDIAADPFAGTMVDNQGRLEFQATSGNFGFLFNAFDFMTGDASLATARNRAQAKRPLTKLVELRREAEAQYREKISSLEKQKAILEEESSAGRVNAGLAATGRSFDAAAVNQVQEMKEKRIFVNRELRQTRHALRKKLRAVESRIKWINIGLVPALVALIGVIVIAMRTYKSRTRA